MKWKRFDSKWIDILRQQASTETNGAPWTIASSEDSIPKMATVIPNECCGWFKNSHILFNFEAQNRCEITNFTYKWIKCTAFIHRKRIISMTENTQKKKCWLLNTTPEKKFVLSAAKVKKKSREQYAIECGMKNKNRFTQIYTYRSTTCVVWKQFILKV